MSIENRYTIVLLFDVVNGNPNGDPDGDNHPRVDAETGKGLVTDVCIKRKIRNYVVLRTECEEDEYAADKDRYRIYVKERAVLEEAHKEAREAAGNAIAQETASDKSASSKAVKERKKVLGARDYMCEHFFDVRTFGAVMSTKEDAGQVRGPVQVTFAVSADQVVVSEHTITRMAVTTEREAKDQAGGNRTMGRKYTVPYGLYRAHIHINAFDAQKTGFDERDLRLLLDALTHMFEHDRSAARGEMSTQGLYVFRHGNKLGNTHARNLFDRIKISKNSDSPPRQFSDYLVEVNETGLAECGVALEKVVE